MERALSPLVHTAQDALGSLVRAVDDRVLVMLTRGLWEHAAARLGECLRSPAPSSQVKPPLPGGRERRDEEGREGGCAGRDEKRTKETEWEGSRGGSPCSPRWGGGVGNWVRVGERWGAAAPAKPGAEG